MLSSFSKAKALQIDESSPYYVTPFNGTWSAANWTTFFGGSGSNGFFNWDDVTSTLTVYEDILIKRSTAPGAPKIELIIDGTNSFNINMEGVVPPPLMPRIIIEMKVDVGEALQLTNGVAISSTWQHWKGITAVGSPIISQFDLGASSNIPPYYDAYDGATVYNTSQTMVTMTGNSIIDKALIGLHSDQGAIIRALHSTIKNCRTGVKIENYIHPTNSIAADLEYKNASYLEGVTIQLDNIIDGAGDYSGYYAVYFHRVHGMHIQGCLLENVNISTFPVLSCSSLGLGVFAYNSSFSMHKSGVSTYNPTSGCVDYNSAKTRVTGFSQAIHAVESSPEPTVRPKLAIQENRIENNLSGITVIGGTDYAFKDNNITLATSINWPVSCPCSIQPKGISLKNVRSFGIYANTIWANWGMQSKDSPQNQMDFIEIDNGGSAMNKIQGNNLYGASLAMTKTGIRIIGMNDRIEPWCANRIENMDNAILIESGATPNNQWRRPLVGLNYFTVRNTYTANVTDLVNNSSVLINYYELFANWSTYSTSGSWNNVTSPLEDGACEPLNCLFWTPLANKKVTESNKITVYPNPSNSADEIRIAFQSEFTGKVMLYTITGQRVLDLELKNSLESTIRTSDLKKGTYMLIFETGGIVHREIIVVN